MGNEAPPLHPEALAGTSRLPPKRTRRARTTTNPAIDGPPPPKKKRVYKTKAMKLAEAAEAAEKERRAAMEDVKAAVLQAGISIGEGNVGLAGSSSQVKVETTIEVESGLAVASQAAPATKVTSKGKGKAAAAPTGEVRLARERATCPKAIMDRSGRVMSQRMFLVDRHKPEDKPEVREQFMVLGSTGNVYTINIGQLPRCNCPDCLKGNVPCKHIVFVFLKVLKVPSASAMWFQKSLLESELDTIFQNAPPTPAGSVAVSSQIRSAYRQAAGLPDDAPPAEAEAIVETVVEKVVKGKRDVIGEDCPVCYSEMTAEEEAKKQLVYDESLEGCGNALHKVCFQMWSNTVAGKGDKLTCVWCRAPWVVAPNAAPAMGASTPIPGLQGVERTSFGYVNMAGLAGISRQRDTSSYYHGPVAGMRMWQAKDLHTFRYNQGD